ncbi:MAG: GUN4 domain-containing protein [Cyanobacteria bacterium P01_A01_bin.84]
MSISLLSSNGTDYNRLQNLLVDQKWGEADNETYRLMRQAIGFGNHQTYLLNSNDIKTFPCQDLLILNNLWLQNSSSRFGFTVLSKIWHALSISETIQHNYSVADRYMMFQEKFAVKVGWKKYEGQNILRPETKFDPRNITSIPCGYYPCKIFVSRTLACQLIDWNVFFKKLDHCLEHTSL